MKRVFLLVLAILLSAPALGQLKLGGSTDNLLEPEKAFRFSARALDANSIEVHFVIADGYYMYRERFRFSAQGAQLGAAEFPPGDKHKDDFFGEVETYRKDLRIRIPARGSGAFDLKVTSQGCADVGVCYIPMDSTARITLASVSTPSQGLSNASAPRFSLFASDMDVAHLFEGNVALVLASFLVFGLLLAFTPCMLPMIPILSGIIAGEGRGINKARALSLSLSYVLGMALAYAAAGIAAAYSGSLLAAALQNAWVLGAFALIFVALALSMFGLYEIRLPAFLEQKLSDTSSRLRGDRQPLRRRAARRRASVHLPDPRCRPRRRGAVHDGGGHGLAADRGGRVGRRAAAALRALAEPRQIFLRRAAARCRAVDRLAGARAGRRAGGLHACGFDYSAG